MLTLNFGGLMGIQLLKARKLKIFLHLYAYLRSSLSQQILSPIRTPRVLILL